jgi:hypothetical protein
LELALLASASPCSPARPRSTRPAAAAAAGLARVAAAELGLSVVVVVDGDGLGARPPARPLLLPPDLDTPAGVVVMGRTAAAPALRAARLSILQTSPAFAPPDAAAALVTGGSGALGSLVVRFLQEGGGGPALAHVVAVGRSGRSGRAGPALSSSATLHFTCAAGDTSTRADTAGLLAVAGRAHRLTTTIQASGVLADGALARTSPGDMRAAGAPKAVAAAALARAAATGLPLASTIAFSSVAGLLGSAGQAAYGAANAHLDAVLEQASASGTPATALQYGAWGGSGMAVADPGLAARLKRAGMGLLGQADGLAALGRVLLGSAAAPPAALMVAALEVPALLAGGGGRGRWAFYADIGGGGGSGGGGPQLQPPLLALALAASASLPATLPSRPLPPPPPPRRAISFPPWHGLDAAGRLAWATALAADAAAAAAGRPLAPTEPLLAAGVDSVAAVDLRRTLSTAAGVDLPATLAFDYPSVAELGAAVAAALPEGEEKEGEGVVVGEAASLPPQPPQPRTHRSRRHHKSRRPTIDPALLPVLPPDGGWYTVPDLASLAALPDPDTALAALPHFMVGRADVGELSFLAPVDVRGLDVAAVLTIEPGQVTAYAGWAGDGYSSAAPVDEERGRPPKPARGSGLNHPALVTLRGMRPPPPSNRKRSPSSSSTPSPRRIAKFGSRLAEAAAVAGHTHVHYDGDTWVVKVDGF